MSLRSEQVSQSYIVMYLHAGVLWLLITERDVANFEVADRVREYSMRWHFSLKRK